MVENKVAAEVDVAEVLHMIADFLQEQNLTKSVSTLVKEANL